MGENYYRPVNVSYVSIPLHGISSLFFGGTFCFNPTGLMEYIFKKFVEKLLTLIARHELVIPEWNDRLYSVVDTLPKELNVTLYNFLVELGACNLHVIRGQNYIFNNNFFQWLLVFYPIIKDI